MASLGTLLVRIAAQGIVRYKADLDEAAKATADAAGKIEQSTGKAGAAAGQLGDKLDAAGKVAGAASGDFVGAAQGAATLAGGAGVAAVGVGLLVAGLAAAAYAAHTGAQEQKAYDKALIMSGNAAGTNASQLQSMASGISKVTGTQYEAAAALAQMAGTGKVASNNLQAFSQVAVQMERTVGQSVGDTVKQFAELGSEPVKASLKLNDSLNYLTASTFAQIKAAEDLGDRELAASLAQNAYADAMASRTAQIAANLGTLEKVWNSLGGAAKSAWDFMLGIGRQAGPEQALQAAKSAVSNLQSLVDRGGTGTADIQRKLDAAKQNLALAQETVKFGERASQLQADGVASEKAKISWMQAGEKYQDKKEKSEEAIKRIRFEGAAAGASEFEIEKRIAVERAKGADKPGRAGKVDNSAAIELEKEAAILATLSGVNRDYEQQLERLQRMRARGVVTEAQYVELITALIARQPVAGKQMADMARAAQELASQQEKVLNAAFKSADSIAAQAGAQEAANDTFGRGKSALAELTLAQLEKSRADLQATENVIPGYLDALELQIDAQKRLVGAMRAGEQQEAGAKALEKDQKFLNDFLDPTKAQTFGDALKGAFGGAADAAGRLASVVQAYGIKQAEIDKAREIASRMEMVSVDGLAKKEAALGAISERDSSARIGAYGDMAGAAQGFFDQNSEGYKLLGGISKAFHLLEIGFSAQAMVAKLFADETVAQSSVASGATQSAAAVTTAGVVGAAAVSQATVQVAAAAASATGVALAAAGASAAQIAAGMAATAASVADSATTFAAAAPGAIAKAGSQTGWWGAIAMAGLMATLGYAATGGFNSMDSAESAADKQKKQGVGTVLGDSEAKSKSLLTALEAMEKNTFTQLKYSSGMLDALKSIQRSMAGLAQIIFRTNGLTSGNALGVQEGLIKQGSIGRDLGGSAGAAVEGLLKLGRPLMFGLGSVIDKLWGKTTQRITDSGLSINGSLGELTQGRGFGQYANVERTQSSWFGLKKDTSNSTINTALQQDAADQLASVFAGISSSLQIATTGFGLDAASISAQLAASVISIPAVSLRGLKGAELQEALNAVFSGAADKLARTVSPGFEALQKAGEGYYETVIRASTALATANGWMERLDQKLFGVSTSGAIAATSLAELFGGINEFNAASQQFYDDYFSDAERAAQSTKEMTQALGTVNLALPGSKDELRALAGTLDLNSEAGRKAYAVLLDIAPEFSATAELIGKAAQDTAGKLLKAFTTDSIDFVGLGNALGGRTTEVFVNVMGQAFDQLAGRIKSVIDGIANERSAIRDAVLQINRPGAMSKDEIGRGIVGANVALPSNAALVAARSGLGAADANVALKQVALAQIKAQGADASGLSAARGALAISTSATAAAQAAVDYYRQIEGGKFGSWLDAALAGNDLRGSVPNPSGERNAQDAAFSLQAAQAVQAGPQKAYNTELAAFNAAMGLLGVRVTAAQASVGSASAAQAAAQAVAQTAQLAYAAALQNFSIDASKSVTRLGKLREETLKYYEAQKQLADLMGNSAVGLRESVRLTRMGQLDSRQSLAQRQADFGKNYSLALSTSGAAQAGYADKLAATLPDLSTALMDTASTRAEWALATAGLLAQSDRVAGLLEAGIPKDYAADSLVMLGQIDAALAELDQSSKSAEKIISDAVNAGSDKTASGLRAVIAALTGQAVPAFASGGAFTNGVVSRPTAFNMGVMGEAGSEAIMPLTNIGGQLGVRSIGGGGNTARLEALVEKLTKEVEGLRFEARATATHTSKTAAILNRVVPDGDAIATRVAA